jgi:hypothetical protein
MLRNAGSKQRGRNALEISALTAGADVERERARLLQDRRRSPARL